MLQMTPTLVVPFLFSCSAAKTMLFSDPLPPQVHGMEEDEMESFLEAELPLRGCCWWVEVVRFTDRRRAAI